MSSVYLGTTSLRTQPPINLRPVEQVKTPIQQEIDSTIKVRGTKEIGRKASYIEAVSNLSKFLSPKNINVSTYLDTKSGMQNTVITDGETEKK